MALISVITLPNGQSYDLRDNKAGHFLGTTETAISAGAIGNSIVVGSTTYYLNPTDSQTALRDQDIVIYNNLVFLANITKSTTNTGTWKQLTFASEAPLVNGVTVDGTSVVNSSTKIADLDTTGASGGSGATAPYAASTNPVATKAYVDANDKIQGVKVNGTALTPDSSKNVNITAIPATIITAGALVDGVTAKTQAQTDNSTKLATTAYVRTAVEELPQAMIFRGTLGTGGTITSLPTAAANTVGDVYQVIVAGTYASQSAKVGDLFVCAQTPGSSPAAYSWVLVPSGNEHDGTVTNVATGVGLTGGPITDTGTIKANLSSETSLGTLGTTTDLLAVGVDSSGKLAVSAKQATDGTYNSSTNKLATQSTVKTAIEALDVTGEASVSATKTIASWSETNGKVAITTQDISIPVSQVNNVTATSTVYGVANASGKIVTGLNVATPSSTAPSGAIVPVAYDSATETLSLKYITVSDVTPTSTSNVVCKTSS